MRIEKVLDGGQSPLNIFTIKPASIGQGTWVAGASTSSIFNFYLNNSTHADGDNFTEKVYLVAGTYTIQMLNFRSTDGGILKIQIDGVTVATQDCYAGAGAWNQLHETVNIAVLKSGLKDLKFLVDGKNGLSSNYYAYICGVRMFRTV